MHFSTGATTAANPMTPAAWRVVRPGWTAAALVALTLQSQGAEAPPDASVGHVVVGGSDTLWSIAAEVRRDGSSIEETMLAIVRANPHAFTDNDPGRLRAGARLTLPWVTAAAAGATAQGDSGSPEQGEVLPTAAALQDSATALDDVTTENAELRSQVARSAKALEQVVKERDHLLAENESLRAQESAQRASEAEAYPAPQPTSGAGDRPFTPMGPLLAVGVLLGLVLGVGGSAGWQRWRRRATRTARPESQTSPLDRLASRVRTVAAPVTVASEPTTPASSTPEDFDEAIKSVVGDPVRAKLDLARAYIDIGDNQSAAEMLREVAELGTPEQRAEAAELLQRV